VNSWEVYASSDEGLILLESDPVMNRIFDTETVLKAGRAAAEIAQHGTREEQSGKFLPPPGWTGHLVTAADVAPKPPRKKKAA
jgi:hypothetical protein